MDVGLAQAKNPLDTTNHYYEIQIIDPGESCYIAIGLARRVSTRHHLGKLDPTFDVITQYPLHLHYIIYLVDLSSGWGHYVREVGGHRFGDKPQP